MHPSQSFGYAKFSELMPPPLLKLAFFSFCVFNLAFYSRFFEWQLTWLHVPFVASMIALVGAAIDGRLFLAFQNRIGACMVALTLLYAINVPLSSWKGDSLRVFTGDWIKALIAFAIAGAVIFNFQQCSKALQSIGWGSGAAGLLMNIRGTVVDGRLVFGRGTLSNSNEGAFYLLLGLPFLWLMLQDLKAGVFKKSLVVLLMINSTIAMIRTGSRGALIGFAVLAALWFFRSSVAGKVLMLGVTTLMLIVGIAFLPHNLKVRYASIISQPDTSEEILTAAETRYLGQATGSSSERRKLFLNSLKVTLAHPIVGVGIGQFGNYMAKVDSEAGVRTGWQGTHNTYTQISSEAGIPALMVFACMITFGIAGPRNLTKHIKTFDPRLPQIHEMRAVSFALAAALIVYSVCVCFDYIAYSPVLPILMGFSIALTRCGNIELGLLQIAQTQQPSVTQAGIATSWGGVRPSGRFSKMPYSAMDAVKYKNPRQQDFAASTVKKLPE